MIIKHLTRLFEKEADPEVRDALKVAINIVEKNIRNQKMLDIANQLKELDYNDPDFIEKSKEITKDLNYPEHEWIPCTFREILEHLSIETWKPVDESVTCFNFKDEILDKPLHILEDDGMGYGAINSYAFSSYITNYSDNKEAQIWI